jgi:hypothetical protein
MSDDEWRPPRHCLRRERTGLPLGGNPLNDLNQDLLSDNRRVQGARIFAATPPDFTPRAHCRAGNTQNDTKVAGNINDDPRNDCWKNKHTDAATEEWGRIKGTFPVVPPLMEIVKIKNSVCDLFVSKLEASRGNWKDKTEFLDQI